METALTPPSDLGLLAILLSLIIVSLGVGTLTYILAKRVRPLLKAAPDFRRDRIFTRISNTFNFPHHRMPRYYAAGAIHITILISFIVMSFRWISMVVMGFTAQPFLPWHFPVIGDVYDVIRHLVTTVLLGACIVAIVRRTYVRPARYEVPERFGKSHTPEAVFGVALIASLMVLDMLFEGSQVAAQRQQEATAVKFLLPGTGVWFASLFLGLFSQGALQVIHVLSYYLHLVVFFGFLCYLPFGRLFHLVVSLPTLFSMKLDKGTVKPVRWGVSDEQLDSLESFGVKKFEDFTWKQMLDFYACADCGRCSDNCPANAVGRPLSPRFITMKLRQYAYDAYPLRGPAKESEPLIGKVLEEAEIWSCTTCGACEEECPLLIEYIDKMVDLRRGMVDEGMVPQSLQKALSAIGKRGNPWGKMEKKRAEWTKAIAAEVPVKELNGKDEAEVLYFVDSITSFDDRMQEIGQATAKLLHRAGVDFGILGKDEKDSGHEVRRFGEEMLYQDIKSHNTEMIQGSGAKSIVTADPHAYNALKNDYKDIPPVEHISQFLIRQIRQGTYNFKPAENGDKVYTYHDPCYLGRHNGVYDDPRAVIDALPGVKRVDMQRCRDRAFCCGGGGLMLFYEPEEEQRMGVLRVKMAEEAGANVIVTACPFCLVNMEDAIKVAGLEGKMEAIDLAELVARHLAD
jgi:Fe-S oxidoreductase